MENFPAWEFCGMWTFKFQAASFLASKWKIHSSFEREKQQWRSKDENHTWDLLQNHNRKALGGKRKPPGIKWKAFCPGLSPSVWWEISMVSHFVLQSVENSPFAVFSRPLKRTNHTLIACSFGAFRLVFPLQKKKFGWQSGKLSRLPVRNQWALVVWGLTWYVRSFCWCRLDFFFVMDWFLTKTVLINS